MKRFRILPICFITYPALLYFCGTRLFVSLVFAVLIHECGHIIAIRTFSVKVMGFTVTPMGLDIRRGGCSYAVECIIALAGPVAGCAAGLVSLMSGADGFFAANLVCSIVNLFPIIPLDGGTALQAVLFIHLDCDRAQSVMRLVGLLTLFALYIAAVMILLYTGWNVTLLAVCAALFFALISR